MKSKITISTEISAPVNQAWIAYTSPRHITKWNFASPDWHSPYAKNELEPGGGFSYRMEAKDGSMGFDFEGIFKEIKPNEFLSYEIGDGRHVEVDFQDLETHTSVTVIFEAESTHPGDLQRNGWQAILDNFKSYLESIQPDTLHFEIEINSPVEKVFKTMISDQPYREWTAVFSPDSYFKGTWEKGSKILFLGPSKEGPDAGMISRISDRVDNKYISIEHLGMIINGEEITSGPQVDPFVGATENYSFYDLGEKTLLKVDMEGSSEFKDYFEDTWPKALVILKEICER